MSLFPLNGTTPTATVVLDTQTPGCQRLTTLRLTLPKFLLAQLNTHRVFTRNAGSSRAIPTASLIQHMHNNPVEPPVWRHKKAGMVPGDEITGIAADLATLIWRSHRWYSGVCSNWLDKLHISKEWANRLLETHSMANVLLTSSDWDNFLGLRMHGDAQDAMQMLAVEIYNALDVSMPTKVPYGTWHIPYFEYTDTPKQMDILRSVAACAQESYRKTSILDLTEDTMYRVISKLYTAPLHASPFEHIAVVLPPEMTPKLHRNFDTEFAQYRALVETGADQAIAQFQLLTKYASWAFNAHDAHLYQCLDLSELNLNRFATLNT